jgi:hypothetical protein
MRDAKGHPKTNSGRRKRNRSIFRNQRQALAKFVHGFLGRSAATETWEWVGPCIGAVGALVLYIIGKFLPKEQKQVRRDVETHFPKAPRARQLGGQNDTLHLSA